MRTVTAGYCFGQSIILHVITSPGWAEPETCRSRTQPKNIQPTNYRFVFVRSRQTMKLQDTLIIHVLNKERVMSYNNYNESEDSSACRPGAECVTTADLLSAQEGRPHFNSPMMILIRPHFFIHSVNSDLQSVCYTSSSIHACPTPPSDPPTAIHPYIPEMTGSTRSCKKLTVWNM